MSTHYDHPIRCIACEDPYAEKQCVCGRGDAVARWANKVAAEKAAEEAALPHSWKDVDDHERQCDQRLFTCRTLLMRVNQSIENIHQSIKVAREVIEDAEYSGTVDAMHDVIAAESIPLRQLQAKAAALKRDIDHIVQTIGKPRLENDLAAINYRSTVRREGVSE